MRLAKVWIGNERLIYIQMVVWFACALFLCLAWLLCDTVWMRTWINCRCWLCPCSCRLLGALQMCACSCVDLVSLCCFSVFVVVYFKKKRKRKKKGGSLSEWAEARKREEREASKPEQELREAKGQQQRFNFVKQQTELYGYYVENKSNHSPVKLCPWVTNQMTKNCCRALQLSLVRKMPIPLIMSGWSFLLDSSNHYQLLFLIYWRPQVTARELDRTLYQQTMGRSVPWWLFGAPYPLA